MTWIQDQSKQRSVITTPDTWEPHDCDRRGAVAEILHKTPPQNMHFDPLQDFISFKLISQVTNADENYASVPFDSDKCVFYRTV